MTDTPQTTPAGEREWLCSYGHDGAQYGITVWAASADDAERKLRSIGAWGRVDGEVMEKVYVPSGGGWLGRLYCDLRTIWANRGRA